MTGRCLEKRQAVAHGSDAKFLQRISVQFGQMFQANRVLFKRISVLFEAQSVQPVTDILQIFLPRAAYMPCVEIAATSLIVGPWPMFL